MVLRPAKIARRRRIIKSEAVAIMSLALPVIGAQLAQMALSVCDTLMAGRLSPEDLAAVAVGASIHVPVLIFAMGILMAGSPIVAHLWGAGRIGELGEKVRQSVWMAVFLSIPSVFVLRNSGWVLVSMGVDEAVITISEGYLRAISWGFPLHLVFFALRFFNEGIGFNRPIMYISFLSVPINILGNTVFMYGYLGFPAMGAVGTGVATSLVVCAEALFLFWWMKRFKGYRPYDLFRFSKPKLGDLRELLVVGVPNGISLGMELSMFSVVALLIGGLGVHMVGGHQIALNIASISYMVPLGISLAMSARVGHAAGRHSLRQIKRAGYTGIALGGLTMSVLAVFMVWFAEALVGFYTRDEQVAAIAVQLLYLAAFFQISDGLQVSCTGALRGLKDTRFPMLVNGVAYWVIGLPLGYLLGMKLNWGARGFWVGMIAGLSTAALLHNLRFYFLISKYKKNHPQSSS